MNNTNITHYTGQGAQDLYRAEIYGYDCEILNEDSLTGTLQFSGDITSITKQVFNDHAEYWIYGHIRDASGRPMHLYEHISIKSDAVQHYHPWPLVG